MATGRAVVVPKNSEKCSMIFNCRKQNHADDRNFKGFRLPQVEQIRNRLIFREGKSGWWMCKVDLSNCFWSICWPAQWRHSFKVYVQGGGFGLVWVKACAGHPGPRSALAFVPTRLG